MRSNTSDQSASVKVKSLVNTCKAVILIFEETLYVSDSTPYDCYWGRSLFKASVGLYDFIY